MTFRRPCDAWYGWRVDEVRRWLWLNLGEDRASVSASSGVRYTGGICIQRNVVWGQWMRPLYGVVRLLEVSVARRVLI